jgi:hypothetical protein
MLLFLATIFLCAVFGLLFGFTLLVAFLRILRRVFLLTLIARIVFMIFLAIVRKA